MALSPKSLALRRKEQFESEVQRIQTYDPCTYCKSAYKQCRIVLFRKDRQRTFHCLECFRRSKKCSHGIAGSDFLNDIDGLLEEVAVERGNRKAIKRRREIEREEEDLREERQERRRREEVRLRRQELEVRADEAVTRREVTRAQSLLHGARAPRPATTLGGPLIEEVEEN